MALSGLAKAVAKVGGQRGWLSDPLDRNGEYISDTTLGFDDSRRTGVAFELASEAKDLHVDTAIEDILMHARGLQQLLTAAAPRERQATMRTRPWSRLPKRRLGQ